MDMATRNDRSSSRRLTDIDVTLVARHGIPFHGILKNISLGGGYIETHNRALVPQTPLTIVLQQNENGVQRIYRMSATVARKDLQGTGVMFNDYDSDTIRCLRTIYKNSID